MRSTCTSLVLLLLLSLSILLSQTTAQTPTPTPSFKPRGNDTVSSDLDAMLACMKCLSKAGLSQVPACSSLQDNPAISSVPVDKLNETQRQCYCGLVSSTEWTKSCSSGSTPQQQKSCSECIIDAAIKISPSCTIHSFTTFPTPNAFPNTLKPRFYPLTTSNIWILPCVNPNLCNAVSVNAIFCQFAALGPYACPASQLTPTLAPMATTATASNPNDFIRA
ncbi:MAG: hypothetical protein JOS17DRAFT_778504 [Linnemannia elongata]|nr:MAG: hypothetical protein JOS17DRAFT_778504 [Linnemannia elongata]